MDTVIFGGIEYRRFDHLYFASACGQFLRKLEPYEPKLSANGYLYVGRRRWAHRVVAECWCHRPEGATDVHHINRNKADNRADNLQWLTRAEHMAKHPEMGRRPMTEDAKAKLRAYRLGKRQSEETKRKLREAQLRSGRKPPPRPRGTKMGSAFFAIMRDANARSRACIVHGVRYKSFTEAAEALGMRSLTLRKRCHSKNFPEFQLEG